MLLPLVASTVGVPSYRSHVTLGLLLPLVALTVGVASYRSHLALGLLLPLVALTVGVASYRSDKLFKFESVGDTVKIGRDKRLCGICVGAYAEGVSRVHMCLEMRKFNNRCTLFAKDLSTYGTGYNGEEISTVQRERQLKCGDTLQIGTFNFTIGSLSSEKNEFSDGYDENDDSVTEKKFLKTNEENSHDKMKCSREFKQTLTRTQFLEDVDKETQQSANQMKPNIFANNSLSTCFSQTKQSQSSSSTQLPPKQFLPSVNGDSDSDSDSGNEPAVAVVNSHPLAKDSSGSSDEGEDQHRLAPKKKKRRILDDEVRTVVAESVFGDTNNEIGNEDADCRMDVDRENETGTHSFENRKAQKNDHCSNSSEKLVEYANLIRHTDDGNSTRYNQTNSSDYGSRPGSAFGLSAGAYNFKRFRKVVIAVFTTV
ncbi:unnamed protein product [Anisakis simplex]|uniref:FHA domain-containing protein n=1 Tax=Anisakis simplex TaxID=6269 RepID=A0A0M3K5P3_ANISI|nr:unnamed protein product [Anisakis simplex]